MSYEFVDNEKILHLITCPICLDTFNDPRMLPCQHSFCKGCLERIAEDRWNRCPQCRKSFRIPFNGGINGFDVNRTIVQLIETLPKQIGLYDKYQQQQMLQQQQQPMLRAKCAQCRKEDVITVCEHCREAICKPCRGLHFKDFKGDIGVKIKTLVKDNDVVLFKEIEAMSNHEKNIQTCVKTKETIQKRVADIIKKLKDDETRLLEEINDFERSETTMMNDNSQRIKELNEINSFGENISKILEKKEETDKEVIEIKANCELYAKKLKEYLKDITNRILYNKIEYFNNFNNLTIDDKQCFNLGHIEISSSLPLTKPATDIYNSIYENTIANNDTSKFETLEMQLKQAPKNKTSLLIRKNNLTNQASFSIKVSASSTTTIPNNRNGKQMLQHQQLGKNKCVIDVKRFFQNHKIIGHEGVEEGEFRHPLGVAVSPINGNIYVTDSWNNRIQIFNDNGNYIKSIEKPENVELHYPYSIHIDKNGRIYVTDQSLIRIKVFDVNFNFIRSIGHYGRSNGCFSGLCDVTTDNDNNIYVCDSGNHRILKFKENGDFIRQWGDNGLANGEFKCPACVTVHHDKVIVSDWGNHRVQIFNLHGEFIKSIGSYGSGPGEFKRPLGVAVDDNGNIVIVDEGNNRIQIFKSDLTFQSKVNGLKCNFQRPWDIAITRSGQIIVSEYYGHCLQIF